MIKDIKQWIYYIFVCFRTTGSPGSKSPGSAVPGPTCSSFAEVKTPSSSHNKALQNVKGDHPSVSMQESIWERDVYIEIQKSNVFYIDLHMQ